MQNATVTVISIAPYEYIHVLDTNSNVTSVISGPSRYTRQDHERLVCGPSQMIKIPPRHYTTIGSPVLLDEDGKPARDKYSNYKLRHGDIEVRTSTTNPEPFPLYPGEVVEQTITKLIVVEKNQALRLRATRDFTEDVDGIGSRPAQRVGDSDDVLSLSDNDDGASDAAEVKRCAGDEWLFIGPATYIPRVEVVIVGTVSSVIVKMNSALRLRALRETRGKKAGAEYLVRRSGHYLPSVDEEIVEMVDSHIITEKLALRLSAEKQFTDVYGITRKAGDEWLVTADLADYHIPDVYESVRAKVPILTLTNRQYCVILDPYVDGEQKLGTKKVVKGEVSFFLLPGETLENEVEEVYVLAEDEALLLQSVESFEDGDSKRASGERWMLQGPIEYIPPVQAKVLERRVALPLDANEGVYVRDLTTGQVRAVIGETYMLKANEELWEKELPLEVEALLEAQKLGNTYLPPMGAVASAIGGGARSKVKERNRAVREKRGFRDKTQVVKFRVPHNCAIQLYNYKSKASRISFGPDMIMLMPDEQFSVMSLSGDKPKRPNVIKSLALQLGPDFMTDILVVETSDHARLKLTLSYNWYFDVDRTDASTEGKIFAVRDFTGDACKAMGSRVRGAVSGVTFDVFHKNSIKIIRASVFGMNKDGKVGDRFHFDSNNLVITNIDVQSVEPVDSETRTSLQKSVQMAIQITTDSQEAAAKHKALREEEEAKGTLQQQRLENEKVQAKAEAQARAEAKSIEGKAAVAQAKLEAEAMQIKFEQEMKILKARQSAEVEHARALNELEIGRNRQLAEIESGKFKLMVDAIGCNTIESIARAGPEMQAKLLGGLGIKSMVITDGKNPINLFQTASQMVEQTVAANATAE